MNKLIITSLISLLAVVSAAFSAEVTPTPTRVQQELGMGVLIGRNYPGTVTRTTTVVGRPDGWTLKQFRFDSATTVEFSYNSADGYLWVFIPGHIPLRYPLIRGWNPPGWVFTLEVGGNAIAHADIGSEVFALSINRCLTIPESSFTVSGHVSFPENETCHILFRWAAPKP